MQGHDTLVANCARLAQAAAVFNVPILATRQITFGPIAPEITKHHTATTKVIEKKKFSMVDENGLAYLKTMPHIKTVVLYGIETQVCILQTAQDLLALGYHVVLVVDAVTSMQHSDRNIALAALQQLGVRLTSF